MAYYSGQASSYQDLLNVLVTACQQNGWMWSDGVLSKNDCFIKLEIIATGSATGIKATGATGVSGATLTNPAPTMPRMGNPGTGNLINFPVFYHLFIFENEVYLKVRFNTDTYYYLAFGKSNINLSTNGLWISATACGAGAYSSLGGISISPITGGAGGGINPSPVAPFWNASSPVVNWTNAVIAHGMEGAIWSDTSAQADFVSSIAPFNSRQPANWSNESILLPINVFIRRSSLKTSLACQFQHSRYLRIDNYEREQIIQLGNEKWMVFPFYRKNIIARDGGQQDHTGTFGWAIRYDGP